LEEQLRSGLRRIAAEEPELWRQIVEAHCTLIMMWAAKDDNLFNAVADIITIRTSRGSLTLPQYLELSGGTLYCVEQKLGSLQEQMLAEGQGVPVIDATHLGQYLFLQKYAACNPDVGLTNLGDQTRELLRPVMDETFDPLLGFYESKGVQATLVTFKPQEVPALMVYPAGTEFIVESRGAIDKGEIADPFARLIGEYVENMEDAKEIGGKLYLNASNPLLRKAAALPEGPARNAVCTLVLQIARLVAGRTLSAEEARQAYGEVSTSMGSLLGL
jgi:HSP90 family molecular chaperone